MHRGDMDHLIVKRMKETQARVQAKRAVAEQAERFRIDRIIFEEEMAYRRARQEAEPEPKSPVDRLLDLIR